jgi:peroxiredoxin
MSIGVQRLALFGARACSPPKPAAQAGSTKHGNPPPNGLTVQIGPVGSALPPPKRVEPETQIAADTPLPEGRPAPALSLPLIRSGRVELSKGSVAVIHFWATWCMPCQRSMPKLQALSAKYAPQGLVVIGISVDDDRPGIAEFAKKSGATFQIAWDQNKTAAEQWKPKAMPTTYVVDRNGVIRFEHEGYHDGEDAELETELKRLF